MTIRSDTVTISSKARIVEPTCETLMAELAGCGIDEAVAQAIRMAAAEAILNAVVHGNGSDPEKQVQISWRIEPGRVEIEVADEGRGFDPSGVPDPALDENLRSQSGRGLRLIRSLMDDVRHTPPGNRIVMTKKIGQGPCGG